jgi:hypothetical protein
MLLDPFRGINTELEPVSVGVKTDIATRRVVLESHQLGLSFSSSESEGLTFVTEFHRWGAFPFIQGTRIWSSSCRLVSLVREFDEFLEVIP